MIEQTRRWLWIDTFFLTIRFAYYLISVILLLILPEMSDQPFWPLTIWFAASFVIPQLFWRPGFIHPLHYTLTELLVSGGLAIYLIVITDVSQGYLQLAAMTVGFLATKKMWWWSHPLFIVAIPFIEALIIGETLSRLTLAIINNAVMFGIGFSFHNVIHSSLKMKQEERNRMARELHDTVGDTFTSVIIGMDTVIYLIDKDPDEAKAKLEVLRSVTRNGLDEVMKNIHQIASNEEDSYE